MLTEPDLHALLKQARHANATQGLAELLLYTTEGRFLQVLEGEQAPLDELYQRIAQDPRHHQVRLLARELLPARRFGDWHMGFRPLSAPALDAILGQVDTHNAAFLLPLLPVLPNALLDKLLDYVHGQPAVSTTFR